jgi:hypothetical protein
MAEHNPTNPAAGKGGAAARKLSCDESEAMLVDFLDGTLPAADMESFQSHRKSCAACAEMFAQAEKGREWLNFLKTEPQVPAVLVTKILAQTSGAESLSRPGGDLAPISAVPIPVAPALPFWRRGGVAWASRGVAQPRLLMTAAMAFFSITLTLNMAGVRLSAVRLADLKPSAMSSNLDKQFHMASARVVRYYDNLRFVYYMEARMRELRQDDLEANPPVDKPDQTAPAGTPQDGGHKNGGKSQGPSNTNQTSAQLWGEKVEASLGNSMGESQIFPNKHREATEEYSGDGIENTDSRAADRAERGIA